jgi:hypothetical protein
VADEGLRTGASILERLSVIDCGKLFGGEFMLMKNRKWLLSVIGAMMLLIAGPSPNSAPLKIRCEELVAKHLESIGSAEARAKVKSRAMRGSAGVIFRLGNSGGLSGEGSILSEGRKIRTAMIFGHPSYPGEHHAFDGKSVTVGIVKPSQRSNLSQFLYEHSFLIREGLIGGTLATGWCLLDLEQRKPALNYKGLKEIEGKELHQLEYKARQRESLMRVNLYFQTDTFRHVLSKYVFTIPAQMGRSPAESALLRDRIFSVTEEFDNFQPVDGLSLPHLYRLVFSYEGQPEVFLTEYEIQAGPILHNIELDEQEFRIQ